MHDSGIIADYLDRLERELSFDISLSRRVQREVEDHLLEAADQPDLDWMEAQRRAIANFGDPREIARQYAASSVSAQTRRLGLAAVLALIGIHLAMKGRFVWYGMLHWELGDHLKDLATSWIPIDVIAFRIALAVGIVGLGYLATRRAPISFHQEYGRRVKHCAVLFIATAGALLASVVIDTIFVGLRLLEVTVLAPALIPALSIGMEIGLVGALVLHIRKTIRRTALASSLLYS
jgi:hypothetical protein